MPETAVARGAEPEGPIRRLCRIGGLGALLLFARCGGGSSPLAFAVVVPSPEYATIQAAIDGVPDGSAVRIGPGTFVESLLVEGKSITLVGSADPADPTVIVPPSPVGDVVTLVNAASLDARDLTLTGRAIGIHGEPPPPPGQGPQDPVSLAASSVVVSGCGTGVYGRFDRFVWTGGRIRDNQFDGLVASARWGFRVEGLVVHGNGGVGIYVDNRFPPTGSSTSTHSLFGVTVEDNAAGGIDVWGGARPIGIGWSLVARNGVFGVLLDAAHRAEIVKCRIEQTRANSEGKFGDGVVIWGATEVSLDRSVLNDNARCGLSIFACDSSRGLGPAGVSVEGCVMDGNPTDIDYEDLGGCGSAGLDLRDGGSNSCNGGACTGKTMGFAPIPPLEKSP